MDTQIRFTLTPLILSGNNYHHDGEQQRNSVGGYTKRKTGPVGKWTTTCTSWNGLNRSVQLSNRCDVSHTHLKMQAIEKVLTGFWQSNKKRINPLTHSGIPKQKMIGMDTPVLQHIKRTMGPVSFKVPGRKYQCFFFVSFLGDTDGRCCRFSP